MKKYTGIYAPYIRQFIRYKRSLGFKFESEEYIYTLFDRFTIQYGAKTVGVDRDLAAKWSEKRPNESDNNRGARIRLVARLSAFLQEIGIPSYVPEPPRKRYTYVPYIFSSSEINLIFQSCDGVTLRQRQYDTSIGIVPALFRLLYGTGIRISEALALRKDQMNLNEDYLVIKATKNGKDRLIPLSTSVSDCCRAYAEYRDRLTVRNAVDDYFFVTANGTKCNRRSAYNWFRRVLEQAGITHRGRGLGPRIHDLRHTFSVHSLVAMAETGLDLYYSLPILSTYLGHQSLEATDQYVRLTAEMYPGILKDVNGISNYVFPKIECYEAD